MVDEAHHSIQIQTSTLREREPVSVPHIDGWPAPLLSRACLREGVCVPAITGNTRTVYRKVQIRRQPFGPSCFTIWRYPSEILFPQTIPRLPHRKRVPKAPALPLVQMPNQRIPPAERLPASPNHRRPVELDDLSLLDDLGRHPEAHRLRRVYPATHPHRDVRALRVRLDMALEVGRAALVLDVGAVGARPAIGTGRDGGKSHVRATCRGISTSAGNETGRPWWLRLWNG